MKKLTAEEKLSFLTLVTGKMPEDFTAAGWASYLTTVAAPTILAWATKTDKMPNKETFGNSMSHVEQRLTAKNGKQVLDEDGVPYLLTDEMVEHARSLEQLWKITIETIRRDMIPACFATMPHSVENYLEDKFLYTQGTKQKVVYFRDLDKEGNVWVEASDSEHPFTSLHGKMKHELNAAMCMHSGERCVLVLRESEDGKPRTEQVNLATLYKEAGQKILARVQKTQKGSAYNFFVERMREEIDMLTRSWTGNRNKLEIEQGLKDLPEMYNDMDSHVDFFEQFYRADAGIRTFTNDPNEPAFNFYDLHNIHDGDTPGFDMFMQGVDPASRDTLKAAIYATFDSRCHLNQYIWMHGEGGDGKSSMLMAMAEYAGQSMYCSLNTDSAKSEFGLEETVGKRIVMFPDIQSGLSVKSGIVHKLTGHDPVPINRKNKPHISTVIDCILWMAANSAPDVNFSNKNEARRCIYIKLHEPPIEVQKKIYFLNPDGSFQLDAEGNKMNNGFPLKQMLIDEMPCILFKCKEAFDKRISQSFSVIRLTQEESAIASDNCSDFDDDTLTYYITKTFTFTNDVNDRMAQPEITNAMNMTLKCSNLPVMDASMKRKMFRKIENYFKCQQKKSNGVKYRLGIKAKEE